MARHITKRQWSFGSWNKENWLEDSTPAVYPPTWPKVKKKKSAKNNKNSKVSTVNRKEIAVLMHLLGRTYQNMSDSRAAIHMFRNEYVLAKNLGSRNGKLGSLNTIYKTLVRNNLTFEANLVNETILKFFLTEDWLVPETHDDIDIDIARVIFGITIVVVTFIVWHFRICWSLSQQSSGKSIKKKIKGNT